MNRRITREEAVKIVYLMDVNNDYNVDVIDSYLEHFQNEDFENYIFKEENIDKDYLVKTVKDVVENLDAINEKINDNSKGWRLNRIAKVDLAILRVAIAEILYDKSIPESVSINEAVEISKTYSNEDSHKFINGILGTVYRGL